jgi:hypothetical protein
MEQNITDTMTKNFAFTRGIFNVFIQLKLIQNKQCIEVVFPVNIFQILKKMNLNGVIKTLTLFNPTVPNMMRTENVTEQLYAPVRQIFCMIGHYCNQALIAVMVVIKKFFKESSHLTFYLCLLYPLLLSN